MVTGYESQLEGLRRRLLDAESIDALEPQACVRAAVMVPLLVAAGELELLFIRRSEQLSSHRGQVAFPGGRLEACDKNLLATALREAEEEVALSPRAVTVLGRLSTVRTNTTGFLVTPFVGLIQSATQLRADEREVAEIFTVPLSSLADPALRGEHNWESQGARRAFPAILYQSKVIWGLTLRITEELLDLLSHAP
ncbi:MAG TPA: CoA pyrophosphatase [Candidatus Binataceae bacterium]|nr:CoA pyrophosphatase [Candidatus Binataceae bacterium]